MPRPLKWNSGRWGMSPPVPVLSHPALCSPQPGSLQRGRRGPPAVRQRGHVQRAADEHVDGLAAGLLPGAAGTAAPPDTPWGRWSSFLRPWAPRLFGFQEGNGRTCLSGSVGGVRSTVLDGATDKRPSVVFEWPLGCLVCDHSEALAGAVPVLLALMPRGRPLLLWVLLWGCLQPRVGLGGGGKARAVGQRPSPAAGASAGPDRRRGRCHLPARLLLRHLEALRGAPRAVQLAAAGPRRLLLPAAAGAGGVHLPPLPGVGLVPPAGFQRQGSRGAWGPGSRGTPAGWCGLSCFLSF